jgi:hypothetical protein
MNHSLSVAIKIAGLYHCLLNVQIFHHSELHHTNFLAVKKSATLQNAAINLTQISKFRAITYGKQVLAYLK